MSVSFNLDGIRAALEAEVKKVDEYMADAVMNAANEGKAAVIIRHTYTDRTGRLTGKITVTRFNRHTAVIMWPWFYADFVNRGTKHNRPYPFTPFAIEFATKRLLELIAWYGHG